MSKHLLLISIIYLLTTSSLFPQQNAKTYRMNDTTKMQYLLYLPDNYDKANTKQFPLLLFLHGGGESGNDIELVKKHGRPKLIEQGKQFPFLVLSPQNPGKKKLWDDVAVLNLLNAVVSEYHVDTARIYLTGLSRGGYGAWRLAINNPGIFAALAVICGSSAPYEYASWLKDLPVWVFHGAKDATIDMSVSAKMVEKVAIAGGDVKFTVYPEATHDAWTKTYENDALYEWMLQQSNNK